MDPIDIDIAVLALMIHGEETNTVAEKSAPRQLIGLTKGAKRFSISDLAPSLNLSLSWKL